MWSLRTADGRRIRLQRLPATLGRGDEADVAVPHPSVEALHAAVSPVREGGLQIAAIGDAPLSIRGEPTPAGHVVAGDELRLGEVRLVVEYEHEPSTTGARGTAARAGDGHATLAPTEPADRVAEPVARRPDAARGRRPPAGRDEPLTVRERRLQFSRVESRKGLLHTDLEQLPPGVRAVFVLGVLLVAAGLVLAVAWIVDLLG